MCGIAGYILDSPGPGDPQTLRRLLEPLRPRGPDDEGIALIARESGSVRHFRADRTADAPASRLEHYREGAPPFAHDVALLNTRYAVIDRSSAAHQPFTSRDGSVTLVFNGAIYNYVELRAELQRLGASFRTASDTEVLAEGYRLWGDGLWGRLNGFWAIALYDGATGAVHLSRDRFGIAPLYIRETGSGLWFASTLRPMRDVGPGGDSVDTDAVRGFIDTSMKDIDGRTFFRSISSARPAEVITLPRPVTRRDRARVQRFWSYPERSWREGEISLDEASARFRDLLFDAVRIRMRTDLNIAFELSGGLDSSSIVAAAAAQGLAVRSYTLEVEGRNEEPFARAMRSRYDLDYRVVRDEPAAIPERLAAFGALVEEPYHAPNVYTHFALRSAMKEDGADVALAGSAGDELLAGYDLDFWRRGKEELCQGGHRISALLTELAIRFQDPARAKDAVRLIAGRAVRRLRRDPGGSRFSGGAAWFEAGAPGQATAASRLRATYPGLSFHDQRLYHFRRSRLPYYLLVDDRYSLTLPVEHRLPFLDFRLVELGLQLPASYLFRNGWTKYVLRKAMEPFLPRRIAWRRRKMGFPFAIRPFLQSCRSRLEPLVGPVLDAGFIGAGEARYDVLLNVAPYRLWRICSTGTWLDAMGGSGG